MVRSFARALARIAACALGLGMALGAVSASAHGTGSYGGYSGYGSYGSSAPRGQYIHMGTIPFHRSLPRTYGYGSYGSAPIYNPAPVYSAPTYSAPTYSYGSSVNVGPSYGSSRYYGPAYYQASNPYYYRPRAQYQPTSIGPIGDVPTTEGFNVGYSGGPTFGSDTRPVINGVALNGAPE